MANVNFFNPYGDASTQAEIMRKRRLAEALMQQGAPKTTSEIAGGMVVPVSPWEHLARALTTGAAGYYAGEAERDTANAEAKKMARLMATYTGQDPNFVGPMEPGAQTSQSLIPGMDPQKIAAILQAPGGAEALTKAAAQQYIPQRTAAITEYERGLQDPRFLEYQRTMRTDTSSGTERIIDRLMKERPELSYAQALSMAQGLARQGLTIEGGEVKPQPGISEAKGDIKYGEEAGKQRAQTDYIKPKAIEEAKGVAAGEAGAIEASLPQLMATVDELSRLGKIATYTTAGRVADTVRRELGLPVGEGATARAEYISLVDNQILPLLRQTFGAAFTQKEGESLRATLGDPDKSPEEKDAVLRSFIDQKVKTLQSRQRESGLPVSDAPARNSQSLSDVEAELRRRGKL